MRTRGKKTPTKKGGAKTPMKDSADGDVEEVTNFEETQELTYLQSPSEPITLEEESVVAKTEVDADDGRNKGSDIKPSDITSTTEAAVDLKMEAAKESEVKDVEGDILKSDKALDDKEDEDAEDQVDDEVEDEVEEDEDEKMEGVRVEDEVEDEEEEVDDEGEEKAQQEKDEFLKEAENEDHTLLEIQDAEMVSGQRKQKRLEVFVGGIDKDISENDLRSIFEKVGTITEIRMARNQQTGKNKGYAFVRYTDPSEAKKAISELHGSQVGEKTCRVIPSEENDLLYLGNINKDWKKEQLLEALNTYSIEKLEEVVLLEDPQHAGKNRGYAFLEFTTHKDALKAFNRLRQRDAVFGGDRTAKVAWAQPLNEPDEDTMAQVKNVFVDGLPPAWDEDQVKERFGKYGEIVKVVLGRNKSSSKRKDYGLIDYATRDAALACIEAENKSEVGDGGGKVTLKVRLSKPVLKSRSGKGDIRGNFPIGKDGKGKVSAEKTRPGKKLSGKKQKVVAARSRAEMSREKNSEFQRKAVGAKSAIKKKSQFSNPLYGSDSASRHRKGQFSTSSSDQRGFRRERLSARDPHSPRLVMRDRLEEAYMYRRGEYAPDAYEAVIRDRRDGARGRKRGYFDLEDPRYIEVPGRSRPRLAHPDTLQVAVSPQYARVPYYEAPAARAPVGHVAQYPQDVGLPAIPLQSYSIYDPLSGASGSSAYSAGGYPYGSVYADGAELQITRGASYVPSSYSVPPPSATRYSVPGANLGRYY